MPPPVSQRLYFQPNGTDGAAPGEGERFEAPLTKVLFNVSGTPAAPVRDLTIRGLVLRDAAPTYVTSAAARAPLPRFSESENRLSLRYLDPHGMPSGGDWALQRSAAVSAAGTERLTVADNLFAPTLWATAAGASHDALLWPVGWMEDKVGGDAPVHTNGEIHGFQTKFCGKRRKFAIDMAGFAVPLDATANVKFQHEWDKGLLETSFLEGIELQGVRVRAVTTSHDVLAWHVNWKTDDVKNFVMNMPSPRINCAWAKKKNASVG